MQTSNLQRQIRNSDKSMNMQRQGHCCSLGFRRKEGPFPWKLHELLENAENEPYLHGIISWMPNGNAFQVHKKDESCQKVLTTYFRRQTKFTSFTRQLYIYGFQKIQIGAYAGAFFHPNFVRCDKQSCSLVVRETNSSRKEDRRFKKPFALYKKMIGGPPPQYVDTYGIPVVCDSETTTESDAYKISFQYAEEAFEGSYGCFKMRDLEPRRIEEMMYGAQQSGVSSIK